MKRIALALVAVGALAGATVYMAPVSGQADGEAAPIYGVKIPPGYRDWQLISVNHLEGGNLKQVRAQLGNDIAIKAFREEKLPFPDGTIICRTALEGNLVRRKQQSLSRWFSRCWPPIFRRRARREYSANGQGLKEVRRDWRLGIR